jgi:hypothetical protein
MLPILYSKLYAKKSSNRLPRVLHIGVCTQYNRHNRLKTHYTARPRCMCIVYTHVYTLDITPLLLYNIHMNATERQYWSEWSERSITWHKSDLSIEMGSPVGKHTIWAWLYSIGIPPDAVLFNRVGRYHVEIRFRSDADLAFYKMSIG